jgi:hypothetical protein
MSFDYFDESSRIRGIAQEIKEGIVVNDHSFSEDTINKLRNCQIIN